MFFHMFFPITTPITTPSPAMKPPKRRLASAMASGSLDRIDVKRREGRHFRILRGQNIQKSGFDWIKLD